MHPTLRRQLARLGIDENKLTVPSVERWGMFLDCVSRAYTEADLGRYTLERSIDLSSAEMRQLHGRLESERNQLAALVGCLGDALVVVDSEDRIQLVNSEAERLLGCPRSELVGRPVADVLIFRERELASFAARLRQGRLRSDDASFVNVAGALVEVAITVNPVTHEGVAQGATIILRDIAGRKQLEGSLRHAQKLESVGRLAAGVAHEINTPIQFVNDNVHFVRDSLDAIQQLIAELRGAAAAVPEGEHRCAEAEEKADWEYLKNEIPRSIEQTLDGLTRVATIVQSMKNFAFNDRGMRSLIDLNAALDNTLVVAGHELKDVAITEKHFDAIPHVQCYRGDINQVFLNLIVNAAQAVGEVVKRTGEMGRIEVTTRCDGADVVVSISDTGGGVPASVQPHIFEPFFTTKEVGRGSGQGLALARSLVVHKHRGQLTFETTEGVGTTFHVRLPIEGTPDSRVAS